MPTRHVVHVLQAGTKHAQGLRIGSYQVPSIQHSERHPRPHRQTGQGQSEPEQAPTGPKLPDAPALHSTSRPASVNNRYASTLASEASSCSESASPWAAAHTAHAEHPAAAPAVSQPRDSPDCKHAGLHTAPSGHHSTHLAHQHGYGFTARTARPGSCHSASSRAGSIASLAHDTSSVSLQRAGLGTGRQTKAAPAARQLTLRAGSQTLPKGQPGQGGRSQPEPGHQHAPTPLPTAADNAQQEQQLAPGSAQDPSVTASLQQLCSLGMQATAGQASSQPALIDTTDGAAVRVEQQGFAAQPSRLPKPTPLHCATNRMQALSPGSCPPASTPSARCRAGVNPALATTEAGPSQR